MTLLTAPNVQPDTADNGVEPINLYKLGMLFVVKCRYWSCRAGNDPDELDLTPDRIDAKALASFGTKDLLDPDKTRKVFQQIEKKARHALDKHSRPFPAANAHFVPWNHVPAVIEQLEALKAEFDEAAQRFLAEYRRTVSRSISSSRAIRRWDHPRSKGVQIAFTAATLSDHHDVVLVDQHGKIVEDFRFDDTAEGWELLRKKLSKHPDPAVAIETSSGVAVERLLEAGYAVYPVNPKAAKRYRERKAPSGTKTDHVDAWSLADALRLDGHTWRPLKPNDPVTAELRLLCRDEIALIEQRTALICQLGDRFGGTDGAAASGGVLATCQNALDRSDACGRHGAGKPACAHADGWMTWRSGQTGYGPTDRGHGNVLADVLLDDCRNRDRRARIAPVRHLGYPRRRPPPLPAPR